VLDESNSEWGLRPGVILGEVLRGSDSKRSCLLDESDSEQNCALVKICSEKDLRLEISPKRGLSASSNLEVA
jgi:hypothetical protein